MQLNQLKRKNPNYKSQRVGRGKKRGKTSGRGTKGQNARAGHKNYPEIRDAIKKLPKMRGRGKSAFKSIRIQPVGISLGDVSFAYKAGETVNVTTLLAIGLISKVNGKIPRTKILGNGTIDKKLSFEGVTVSASTKKMIEGAGGEVK